MPLTPPPNYTGLYIAAALGASLAAVVALFTRSTLPIVGDSQHNLPHGGRYRDGTKAIDYFKPAKLNSVEPGNHWYAQPWLLVLLLVALICLSGRHAPCCPRCNRVHSA
uniref:Movement protein TGB2 n=2 Tax=root TaxID=1 RepID=A0A451FDP9_9VIRU|nr:triple gene block protein 2 [synthetic construct]BBD19975.1 unnamed protein product [Potato virus S]